MLESLTDAGFVKTSPIQELTLVPILENKDVFAQAETGSGKTGAFAIPIIEKFLRNQEAEGTEASDKPIVNFVVLSPTRELAQQTDNVFKLLGKKANIKSCCVIGGEDIQKQKKIIGEGISVLVATPGRLMDLVKQKVVDLSTCKAMVFDEADRLFDMGFQKDIEYILGRAPKDRQLIMLSATSNQDVLRTAYKFNSHPEELKLNSDSLLVDHIQHRLAMLSSAEKFPLLINILRKKEDAYAIVFCNTQVQTHTVAEWLIKMGFKAKPISGRLAQNKRTQLLKEFREKKVTILCCTDVAARGLDIKKVNLVINYDLPQEAANYVHRIGRTARAGEDGEAISFCAHEDCEHLEGIKELIETDIEKLDLKDEDFATDACKKPRIDRKSLRVIESRLDESYKKKQEYKKNNDKKPMTMKKDTTTKEEYKPRERKPFDKEAQKAARGERVDRRYKQLTGYSMKSMMPELLKFFRIDDETLIGHEVISQGRKMFFLFGPRETTYKFTVKPVYKRLLLPFLISIIKNSTLKLFVKVSYKPKSLFISFSGADEKMLSDNNNELLSSFEHLVMVYLQSRIFLDRDLKIVLKGGKTKIERENRSNNRDKDLEKRLRGLAQSKRKQVLENQEAITLKALNPKERRIIHQYFQDDKKVGTTSLGSGNLKEIRLDLR